MVTHFRKSFPANVDAGTLKKLDFAPNNESYVLNVLRFLGLIDQEGKKTTEATKIFNQHEDAAFSKALAPHVAKAYSELFKLHGEPAWDLDSGKLITFFRSHDGTTAVVGKLQASTFKVLAAYSGHGDFPAAKPAKKAAQAGVPPANITQPSTQNDRSSGAVGLTVRVEVNLPADGDQATYDRIFKSIRENLLNG
ncbi:MAG: hypothetical protein CAF45_016295 [Nitrospira sp. CG24E]|nr:MAG: hypothetical protein CAF45_016295 [Nitrospira sp. CG24E]